MNGVAELRDGRWEIECAPHVRMRLRNFLPRAKVSGARVSVRATPDVAADLEAFVFRFPLEIRPPSALQEAADAWRARQESAKRILAGDYAGGGRALALPARDYQKQAAALAHATGGLLLGDELGLGKTVSAIALLAMPGALPALVVVPTHMTVQWAREIARFLPSARVHTLKSGIPYDIKGEPPDVLVSTYHKLNGWADKLVGAVRTVIFDECQELRRTNSQKYQAARAIAEEAAYRLGLSATPVYNYGGEFWSVCDVLRPGALGELDEFAREWGDGGWDPTRMRLRDPAAFGSYARDLGLYLRRTKREVGRELAPLERIVHEVDMDAASLAEVESKAVALARIVLESAQRFDRMRASSELSNAVRMATGISKAKYAAAFVRMILEAGDGPVILCGWHREVYRIWEESLREFSPCWVTGAESPTAKQASVDRFVAGESNLLIMSLRSGAGIDGLQRRCSRIVFGELDWSPGVHEQCIGRVYRDGQPEPVFAYFLVGSDGCDPIMVDVLGLKTQQIDGIRGVEGGLTETIDPDHVQRLARAYVERFGMGQGDTLAQATDAA